MKLPEELETQLRREFQGKEPQPEPAVVEGIIDRVCLESQYSGQPVAWCEMIGGRIAVLAVGAPEVEAILLGVPDDELVNVVVFQADQY
jgi:hypothetical protein